MLIGILQCGHFPNVEQLPSTTYTDLYSTLLKGHGFTFRTWSAVDMEFPASVYDADGWLLSGSKHGAYEDLPFIPPLEQLIRDIYDARVPLVGICFGHQIVAQALGGQVEKHSSGWNCGPVDYDFEGRQTTLTAWHQDQVVSVPAEASVTGSSADCDVAFIRYKGNAFTMQPHPEFDDAAVRTVMKGPSVKYLSDEALEKVRAGLGIPLDNAKMADKIAQFFRESRDMK